ncbi:MAG: AMP-binding protein, partial [Firmicutes bacterium]|nr:AMP-binding protein [Bacillota bacterium]
MIYTQKGLDWALKFIDDINADTSKYVMYKQSRPIANLKHMMVTTVDLYPGNTAFMMKFPGDKTYTSISFARVLEEMNALGTALIARGFKGKRIAVCGENCYYWCLSYLAAVCGVGVVVPLDKELPDSDLKGLAAAAEVSCVLTTKKHLEAFREMMENHEGSMECVVGMYTEPGGDGSVLSLKDLIEEGRKLIEAGDRSYIDAQIDEEAMGILLYTSGTTGLSKGVMLSHKNICADLMSSPNLLEVLPTDIFFNVLPLHHTYACTCDFLMPMYKGTCVAFCEGLKYIQKNLKEVQPTFFLGVPAIFESLYKAINKNIKKQGKDKTVAKVLKINRFTKKIGIDLVPKFMGQILDVFGGRMQTVIAGGAAMDPAITEFFLDLGFKAVQGYGLTECSPIAALNPDKRELSNPAAARRVL